MKNVFLFCRTGFEKDCAAEFQHQASLLGISGFVKAKANDAFIIFECFVDGDAERLVHEIPLQDLAFTRQMFAAKALLENLPESDRVTPIVQALSQVHKAGELRVETPDTNESKTLSVFCRKFAVPLRQALRQSGSLLAKENSRRPIIHVCFIAPGKAFVGYSHSNNSSPYAGGIPRLKFPANAPSRSTLKLDEAFNYFIPKEDHETRLRSGLNAVDLGACPGGWTYQLVRRGMMVSAIDNGPMDEKLMESGQVKHYQADGFKWEPIRKNIYWLVCDMVEKPSRVAELIEYWAINNWFKEAIFNLKLPMKSRFKEVQQILAKIDEILRENGVEDFRLSCKQLYHDRDEVTVHLWLRPNSPW